MNVTALVLSTRPYPRTFGGLRVVTHRATIRTAAQMLDARLAAIRRVETDHFFYLDDDDDLPENYGAVIEKCVAARVPLAYTAEQVTTDAGIVTVRDARPYDRALHLADSLFVHHLALCHTESALNAAERLPRGQYWPESLLYWELARGGAVAVPEVGYHWRKRADGMHLWPETTIAQVRSTLWMKANP